MWEPTNLSPQRHAINAILFIVVLALGFAIFSPNAVAAANSCGAHEDVIALLDSNYAESQTALGLSTDGAMIEVFSAKDGATWTILATQTNGTTCIVTSGRSWVPDLPVLIPAQTPSS